jgi:mannose-6-phosphate isomerase-like protein (cupin superfamily)
MVLTIQSLSRAAVVIASISISVAAQTVAPGSAARTPSKPIRPFVVLAAQSLDDLEKRLQPSNKTEELIGGEGMELRVAVQHEKNTAAAAGELHDASDDVYYVIEGSATLTLGGTLDTPHEIERGEWRGPRIVGGQKIEVRKGDLIIVPRGTPHQRSTTGQDFTMILIKVYAEPRPAAQPKEKRP